MSDLIGLSISNAAGECKHLSQVQDFARTAVDAITVGSITMLPRGGNDGRTSWFDEKMGAMLNSLGLPNPGIEYYQNVLPEMAMIAHGEGKLLRVSVAGFDVREYAQLAYAAAEGGADQIEVNAGCPNVWGKDGQKPIPSFHPELLEHIISRTSLAIESLRLDIKLSPYSDPLLLQGAASILSPKHVRAVVCSNTFPNAFAFDDKGTHAIGFREGLAGLSGTPMRFIGMGQVAQFRSILLPEINVVGVGGIGSGKHVLEYQRAGADGGVQIGTHYFQYGPKVFGEVLQEYIEILG